MSQPTEQQTQLVALQEMVMHLQHEFEQVHQVVLAQAEEIAALRRDVARVRGDFSLAMHGDAFPTPAEDRPPHY